PRQTRLLRVDWPVDSCRTHAAVSAHPRRTGGSGHFDCFVAFAAGGRRDACPPEPAPWPGRSPRSFSSGSFCFCDLGGGVGLWRPSRPEFRRTRALLRVFVLGAWLVLFNLGSQHCPGTICAPPLACYAGFLEPLAGGRLSGSTGGTRCPCWLFLGAVYDRCGGGGLVYFLLAWLSSAATIFGPTVAVTGRADDSCKRSARVDLCAFFLACDSVCPVPFAGLAAHGVGGSGRMDSLVYGFHRSA